MTILLLGVCSVFHFKDNKTRLGIKLLENDLLFSGIEVLRAVTMKSTVFWNVMPCSSLMLLRNVLSSPSGSKSK
jgi:hypothetical protein